MSNENSLQPVIDLLVADLAAMENGADVYSKLAENPATLPNHIVLAVGRAALRGADPISAEGVELVIGMCRKETIRDQIFLRMTERIMSEGTLRRGGGS